jgi:hypothetical protein
LIILLPEETHWAVGGSWKACSQAYFDGAKKASEIFAFFGWLIKGVGSPLRRGEGMEEYWEKIKSTKSKKCLP